MNRQTLNATRGDTFRLECEWTYEDDTPRSLAGVAVAAWLKNRSDATVIALTYTLVDEPGGLFELSAPTLNALTVGFWNGDVEFTQDGMVISTETYMLRVNPDVTNAA